MEGIIFLQDAILFKPFIDISCDINLFPAGNAGAPAGKKTVCFNSRAILE